MRTAQRGQWSRRKLCPFMAYGLCWPRTSNFLMNCSAKSRVLTVRRRNCRRFYLALSQRLPLAHRCDNRTSNPVPQSLLPVGALSILTAYTSQLQWRRLLEACSSTKHPAFGMGIAMLFFPPHKFLRGMDPYTDKAAFARMNIIFRSTFERKGPHPSMFYYQLVAYNKRGERCSLIDHNAFVVARLVFYQYLVVFCSNFEPANR